MHSRLSIVCALCLLFPKYTYQPLHVRKLKSVQTTLAGLWLTEILTPGVLQPTSIHPVFACPALALFLRQQNVQRLLLQPTRPTLQGLIGTRLPGSVILSCTWSCLCNIRSSVHTKTASHLPTRCTYLTGCLYLAMLPCNNTSPTTK